ncbi:hypothetical protein TEA_018627 [Camellia sinensis var. sinensis]|uniref:F-actin-capping protein subunit beta n=1 Tax=Camellia sinensis var. sinensis TaxID=542762 RepID=A0A4S4ENJ3_CAMSN|nr:hypothetical protein TEA_018627 [Camellia sinensis var. sinensis]
MEAAMGLMRRIPPNQTETALSALLSLMPEHSSDLLSQVDQPLQVPILILISLLSMQCTIHMHMLYLSPCSFVGLSLIFSDSIESMSSAYRIILSGYLHIYANTLYKFIDLPGTIFSYSRTSFLQTGKDRFYAMWIVERSSSCVNTTEMLTPIDGSKSGHGRRGYLQEGAWDAIHVIEVGPEEEGMAHYCLTSTVMLSLTTNNESSGTFNLSGSIRRQMNTDLSVADGHLCNMGKMIEELEGKLRNSLDQVYFGKTKEMVCTLRPPAELVEMRLPDS